MSKMDCRCPRALQMMPKTYCSLAVNRLRAIRTAGHELSEEEEDKLPGCPWAVNSQTSNYCFFRYLEQFAGEHTLSDVEVASLNCLSIETVRKVEKEALTKIRESDEFQALHDELDGESPFESCDRVHGEYEVNR